MDNATLVPLVGTARPALRAHPAYVNIAKCATLRRLRTRGTGSDVRMAPNLKRREQYSRSRRPEDRRRAYVDRIINGHVVSRGVSTVGVFKSGIRTAALVARGSDEDPWIDAKRRLHSEF